MSVVSQIDTVEGNIASCEKRLDEIKRSLRLRHITNAEELQLQEEEKECQAQLENYKTSLRSLRRENMKTMLLSVVLLGSLYVIYFLFWT